MGEVAHRAQGRRTESGTIEWQGTMVGQDHVASVTSESFRELLQGAISTIVHAFLIRTTLRDHNATLRLLHLPTHTALALGRALTRSCSDSISAIHRLSMRVVVFPALAQSGHRHWSLYFRI
jgi:hypothetical protein